MTFEEKLKRIDEIVKILNSGNEAFENQINLYAEGIRLLNECRSFLENTTKKIIDISKEDANAN
jgi:exodeoxyribonuclease VII small subunit